MDMFGKETTKESANKSKNGSVLPASTTHALNSLVQGTMVEGSVHCKTDFRVDGNIKGKLFCDAKVIIGPTGFVEGEIRCQNAVIEGKFEGVIQVAELLNIRESAAVSGDVTTNKLIVQSGAVFNVACTMGEGKSVLSGSGFKKESNPSSSSSNAGKVAEAK